jgi:mannose-1-phosphate guanylyltransferase
VAQPFWTLVLAGGRGSRLNDITGGIPKQFWSPDMGRTMVEQTIARMEGLVPRSKTVTVIGPDQERFLEHLACPDVLGLVVSQPRDRGTGIAVLWGLSAILARDPDAIVMVTPADHGIRSEVEYRDGVRVAVRAVAERTHGVVVFGTTPNHPAEDYGWIVPAPSGDGVDHRLFRPVQSFAEKPPREQAVRLMSAGALWNTMVLVGRAQALVETFRSVCPDIVDQARDLARSDDAARRAACFAGWPVVDFSREVLTRASDLTVYTWRPSLGWCDLGTEARVLGWRDRVASEEWRIDHLARSASASAAADRLAHSPLAGAAC